MRACAIARVSSREICQGRLFARPGDPGSRSGSIASLQAERTSDRELVVTRSFNAPPHIVFEAWTKPELFKRWWVPKSMPMSLVSCEMDVRAGGVYRLVFDMDGDEPAGDPDLSGESERVRWDR